MICVELMYEVFTFDLIYEFLIVVINNEKCDIINVYWMASIEGKIKERTFNKRFAKLQFRWLRMNHK